MTHISFRKSRRLKLRSISLNPTSQERGRGKRLSRRACPVQSNGSATAAAGGQLRRGDQEFISSLCRRSVKKTRWLQAMADIKLFTKEKKVKEIEMNISKRKEVARKSLL